MRKDPSEDRLIKNELLLRGKNANAAKAIKRYYNNEKEVEDAPISFICECSMIDCDKHVNASIKLYEKLHKRKDQFTIFPGHKTTSVEKVVDHQDDFDVVQKFALDS